MTDDKTNSLKMIITCTSKIIFNYLTDFSYFPLKNKFWMLQDMVTQNGSKIEVLKGGVVMVCVIKSPKQHLGDLLFLLRFLLLLLLLFSSSSFFLSFFLSFRGTWTCPQQISGTTGQNVMKLSGVIDICF